MQNFFHKCSKATFFLTPFRVLVFCAFTSVVAADDLPPLQTINQTLDLQKFSGDWYVYANIPVGIPFFNDGDAYNYKESYTLREDGTVEMNCVFNKGSFSGKLKRYRFTADAANQANNAEWDVRFVWPFKARYMVIYLDADYATAIVAVPSRRWAWIMTREAEIAEAEYMGLVDYLSDNGFATEKLRRIPHSSTAG
jgi:apolipoprotein D and lipocalin family protein